MSCQNLSLDIILEKHLSTNQLGFVSKLLYGRQEIETLELSNEAIASSAKLDLELQSYSLLRTDRTEAEAVRLGLCQNSILRATTDPIEEQRNALLEFGKEVLALAYQAGVQVFCFQELWVMPLALCTQKKLPWVEFAEDAFSGPTTSMLSKLAKEYDMVIVSPFLERCDKDFLWNSAVVIDAGGQVLGVSRKNHVPISGRQSEAYYYKASSLGVPVFQTKYGRIGVAICYDRHHPQNWYMHGLNGAQIVMNPSASIGTFGEPLWGVEGRFAAAANGFYVGSINRVGSEHFEEGKVAGPFFGSSYVSGPSGERTKGLSTHRSGLLVVDVDLKACGNQYGNKEDLLRIAKEITSHIHP